MRTGTFSHMEQDRFVINTAKGPWKLWPTRKGLPVPPQNSPIKFETQKDDKGYWRISEIYVDGQQPMPPVGAAAAAQAPLSQDPEVAALERQLEEKKRAAAAKAAEEAKLHPPAGYRDRTHPDDQRAMFVTGVVTRAMGSGKFEAKDIWQLTSTAVKAWDMILLGKAEPSPPAAPEPTPKAQPWPGPNPEGMGDSTRMTASDTGSDWEPDEPPIPEDDGR